MVGETISMSADHCKSGRPSSRNIEKVAQDLIRDQVKGLSRVHRAPSAIKPSTNKPSKIVARTTSASQSQGVQLEGEPSRGESIKQPSRTAKCKIHRTD